MGRVAKLLGFLAILCWAEPGRGQAPTAQASALPPIATPPVVATPPLIARMVRALNQQQPAAALTLARRIRTTTAPSPRDVVTAQLVTLIAADQLGRAADARAALDTLAGQGIDLGRYGAFLRVRLHSIVRQCDEAATAVASLPVDSMFRLPSEARVVACWLSQGQIERAADQLAPLESQATRPRARAAATLLRARVNQARGDLRGARDTYRALWIRDPWNAWGQRAREQLNHLEAQGLTIRPWQTDELLQRAQLERSRYDYHRARRSFSLVLRLAHGPEHQHTRQRAELSLAELDIVDRRYGRALTYVHRVRRPARDPTIVARSWFLEGDILERRGQLDDAVHAYQQTLRTNAHSPLSGEAAIRAGRIAYRHDMGDLALALADWMLSAPTDRSGSPEVVSEDGIIYRPRVETPLADHGHWLKAWLLRRAGQPTELVESHLAQIDPAGHLGAAAAYWQMRGALETGRPADAAIFAALTAQRAPGSFYALAAYDQAIAQGWAPDPHAVPSVSLANEEVPRAPPAIAAADLEGPLLLMEHGLSSAPRALLKMLPVSELSDADRAAAAWIYFSGGDIHRAAIVTRPLVHFPWALDDPNLLALAYPQAYPDRVEAAASEHGVPASLIWAVMREESSFDPRAVSSRKARGLMQMIPSTGRRMARQAELRPFGPRRLFQPEVAIQLGATYLATLLDRFDGNVTAAVAAYHAGESTVESWRSELGAVSDDEFIERIPFAATAHYVKKVLTSFGTYRRLYEPTRGPLLPRQIPAPRDQRAFGLAKH